MTLRNKSKKHKQDCKRVIGGADVQEQTRRWVSEFPFGIVFFCDAEHYYVGLGLGFPEGIQTFVRFPVIRAVRC